MNQGRSEEIERIFERVDAALAVRTQGRYRSRCFVDRASIALALGKPPNATAQQMRSARLRLLLLNSLFNNSKFHIKSIEARSTKHRERYRP